MTPYQDIITAHLTFLFSRGDNVTPVVVIAESEREFVIEVSIHHGYIPVFSEAKGGYFQFSGIKMIFPC